MKFGKSADEAAVEPSRGGGGGFMKAMKDGDNEIHIMDEPDAWTYYWEHFPAQGFSYPCTNDRDTCPGCTSDNEKERKASRKIAFNAWDGEYVNVWKVAKTVADKLKNRADRIGTITDRPYLITRLKDGQKYDYDLEGGEKTEIPAEAEAMRGDPEAMLADAYEQQWGDSAKATSSAPTGRDSAKVKASIKKDEPPKEAPESISEADLRKMDPTELREFSEDNGFGKVPATKKTTDSIVDWMLEQ